MRSEYGELVQFLERIANPKRTCRLEAGSELSRDVIEPETGNGIPHCPDAFFTLRFPNDPEGRNKSNFFYEADRNKTSIPKMLTKLKGRYEFVGQKKHQGKYGIKRIRAVLIETLETKWAEDLRQAVSEICSLPLFWFTASEIFTTAKETASENAKQMSIFLVRPEILFQKIWVSTKDDSLFGLTD